MPASLFSCVAYSESFPGKVTCRAMFWRARRSALLFVDRTTQAPSWLTAALPPAN